MCVVLIRVMEMSGKFGMVYVWVERIGQQADFNFASPPMVHKGKFSLVERHFERSVATVCWNDYNVLGVDRNLRSVDL